jgi:hypothetical protein
VKPRIFLAKATVASSLFLLAIGQSPSTAAKAAPLTERETLRVLVANRDVSLKNNESCQSVKNPADKTVGDYLATMFARLAEGATTWRSEVTFRRIGVATDKQWQIRLSLYGSDAGENYDTGVSFVYNLKRAKMMPGSFQCSGTS